MVNGIVNIDDDAFRNNQIDSLIIPSTVTSIGYGAFDSNPLTSVTSVSDTPPSIQTNTFGLDRSTINLYIPTGTEDPYVNDQGALWTGFNLVTETDFVFTSVESNLDNEVNIISNANGLEVIFNNDLGLNNYSLYSLSGKLIKTGNKATVSTNEISNGIYILKLDFNEGTLVKKVAVK
jgi:hypothetical protein